MDGRQRRGDLRHERQPVQSKLSWGRCTQKPGKLYLHVFDWPKGESAWCQRTEKPRHEGLPVLTDRVQETAWQVTPFPNNGPKSQVAVAGAR